MGLQRPHPCGIHRRMDFEAEGVLVREDVRCWRQFNIYLLSVFETMAITQFRPDQTIQTKTIYDEILTIINTTSAMSLPFSTPVQNRMYAG
jgi:hypothetical protein